MDRSRPPCSDQRTALYRLYGADDQLLYVGVSGKPLTRWGQHAGEKVWWPEVAKLTLAWYDTRDQALDAELCAIGSERPRHNSPLWNQSNTPGPTPRQTIRIETTTWGALGVLVGAKERSRVVREFIAWYVREPGAQLPQRPPVDGT